MSKVIIVGHKNPDTDSIVSAIVAQELFSKVFIKDSKAYRAGELNNETKFVLEEIGVSVPSHISEAEEIESVALVDHNEMSQVFDGLKYEKVDFILDHHKISLATEKPIYCHVQPIGSTSSLVAKMLFEHNVEISNTNAKLLLAGILSDTLNLTSPTKTEEDHEIVSRLNKIAGLEIEAFVKKMFKAKSSLEGISTEDIITLDYKNFEMGKSQVGIGTWETTDPESVGVKKNDIIEALRKKKLEQGLDYAFFMVVDIIKQVCQLYVIDSKEKDLAEKVFGQTAKDETITLDGVVSRKKQIVPPLTEELSK